MASGRIRDIPPHKLRRLMAGPGLRVDYGAATVQVRCGIAAFGESFQAVYGAFAEPDAESRFADLHVQLPRGKGLRAVFHAQSRFRIEGKEPFQPFPASHALPLFEWGVNWSFAQQANQHILLHSGVLARNDRAIIMAAPPGSGKSTLSAAMMLRGFRLLSDEFGVLCPESGDLLPMLKPVALKNQSVEVIRAFEPDAVIGTLFTKTRKGDVAHLAPDEASVDARHRPARPALVLFPAFEAGAAVSLERLPSEDAFAHLAFNSFNYHLLGPIGFEAVADVIESCPAYKLRYSNLDQAIERIGELLDEAGERRGADTA